MKQTLLLILLSPFLLFSQIDSTKIKIELIEDNIHDMMENHIENMDEEVEDLEEVIDLIFSIEQKININDVSPEMAFTLLKLTEYQYYQLLLYLEKYGELVSVNELYAIEGWGSEDVARILPFITVENAKNRRLKFVDWFKFTQHRLLLRYGQIVEKRSGYERNRKNGYLGDPTHLLFRYQVSNPNFSLGISAEKDSGEEFFRKSQKRGFDFYSFHFSIKKIWICKNITFGDYRLNFGQGLVLGNSFAGGKGGSVGGIRRFSVGVRPVTLLNESRFFRGFATEIGNTKVKGTIFYGHRFYDGKIVETNNRKFYSGSLTVNGYHRTEKEIQKRETLFSRNLGFNFQWNRTNSRFGMSAIYTHFNYPILLQTTPAKKYSFSGNNHFTVGIDHQIIWKKSILFGEIALSRGFHLAWIEGVIVELDPRCKFGAVFRYYDRQYAALEGISFGVNKPNQNEAGLFLTAEFLIGKRSELLLHYDIYRFPWLKFLTDFPSFGNDASIRFTTSLSRNTRMVCRYGFAKKEKNQLFDYHRGISTMMKHKVRFSLTSAIFDFIKLKTEIDFHVTNYNKEKSLKYGAVIFQDFEAAILNTGLKVKLRFAMFETDSYEERIYCYESDLLYTFNCTPYFGRGCRFYTMLQYKYRFLEIQLRYSQTFFTDRNQIGSGLEMIDKNSKSDIKAQLYFRF